MKIRVTYEVDDVQRVAISVHKGDGFKPANRETIEEFLRDAGENRLAKLDVQFRRAFQEIIESTYTSEDVNTEAENQ